MAAELKMGDRPVGPGHPVFVIAEIGVNHDGSVRRALELVELAAATGADAVKLQLFRADRLMNGAAQFASYQQDRTDAPSPAAMLRQYELSDSDIARVTQAIVAHGMAPIATPFSIEDVDGIESQGLPGIKIASPDLVNRPLLLRAAQAGRPLLISTGAATLSEVAITVGWLNGIGAAFALLHCVSSYPTPAEQANLCWINELARFEVPVGYSDHSTDPFAGALAVAAGATVVEKHLTYDRDGVGPDHSSSADPLQFNAYVQAIRRAEILRGQPGKRVLEIEQDVRHVSRQSLVLARGLRAGERLREADLIIQRPGHGIPAADWQNAVGKIVRTDVQGGTMLSWEMLSDAA
jgi:sialic acid synthase SpsE